MRDAARLGKRLIAVARGELTLVDGLTKYEAEMLSYSARVVRESAKIGHERMGQDLLPENEALFLQAGQEKIQDV